jgi:hypothetical protein
MPSNVTVTAARSKGTFSTPMRAPDAPPEIVHIVYTPAISRGPQQQFSGTVWTSSNVASIELRTNLFSINAKKRDAGWFTFAADVYDLPPIFVRPYSLRVIARNTAGVEAEEDLPFRIR